jgi:hypothetical protein
LWKGGLLTGRERGEAIRQREEAYEIYEACAAKDARRPTRQITHEEYQRYLAYVTGKVHREDGTPLEPDGSPPHWSTLGSRYPEDHFRGYHEVPEQPFRRDSIPAAAKNAVFARDGGQCQSCGATHDLEIDHIIPLSRGGSNTEKNLQVLCTTCNRRKGNRYVG